MQKKVLAIIPARSGSKGIKDKNIINLNGKPLIAYSIEAGLKSKYIDKVVVTTDGEEIAKVAKNTDTRLEINSSHGFLNSSQLVKIKGIGNKFIIGSDAHIPQNVGNFDLAMKIVKEASVDLSLIENITYNQAIVNIKI